MVLIDFDVVAPSLTPDSYNAFMVLSSLSKVVAPSLTPDSYNIVYELLRGRFVVAPSLTPDSYNHGGNDAHS